MTSIDSTTSEVFGLVLAAGRSRRFAGDKRRALLPCSRSLLQASVENAQAAFPQTWVVLRPDDDAQALGLSPDVQIVRCADADLGMGHSLACGIRALQDSAASAAAVLLADMPWIKPDTLRQLASMADPRRIALPVHAGQRGHPVIIGRNFWPELVTLQGDQGARAVIAANQLHCEVLQTEDAGVLRDADTRQALAQACQETYRST
ncbi:nucleotidyltransferase family protein [Pseudomonas sp. R1-18]|uniref:nucleotidyltransferase family protein n=1 Tax=Pseudomonas sp. R1-18 TaxID=1632772 RepID=UPI003DA8378B